MDGSQKMNDEWVEKRFDIQTQMSWARYGETFDYLVKPAEEGRGSLFLGIPKFKKAVTWRDFRTDELVMRYVPA